LDNVVTGVQTCALPISGGMTLNLTVNAGMGADGADIGRKIVDEILRFERSSGKVFARA
jgi:hypothetical protein